MFGPVEAELPAATTVPPRPPDAAAVERLAALVAGAERPAFIIGSDVYWDGAWEALAGAVEALRVPCYFNGLGRGCLPADHDLAFLRTRGLLKQEADLVVVMGTPLDFRLGFGRFGSARVAHVVDSEGQRAGHVEVPTVVGDLGLALGALAEHGGPRVDHEAWITRLREAESAAALDDDAALERRLRSRSSRRGSTASCVGASRRRGGDLRRRGLRQLRRQVHRGAPARRAGSTPVRTAAWATGWATPSRRAWRARRSQIVVLLGDGAAGFSLMDADTLVRHDLPVVMIVGNNGMWGLEKHPMQALYGWDVACDLQPGCRYDQVVRSLGGAGETVVDPEELGPALDRAFSAGVPYLVNVLTDPADVYPRSSNLA